VTRSTTEATTPLDGEPRQITAVERAVQVDRWPWRGVIAALLVLLVGVIVACLVALALTLSTGTLAERMLSIDVAFEDEAEDVHVAVLDLRHEHRNLALIGPTRAGIQDHAAALAALREELDELQAVGVEDEQLAGVVELRPQVDAYARDIGTALALHATGRNAYDEAFDVGLARLATWERIARGLDEVATRRSAEALGSLSGFTRSAAVALVAVLVAVLAVGIVLTIVAVRLLRELRRLSAAQQRSAAGVRELLQSRSDFFADVSHELRTPITVVRGTAELALRTGPPDDTHVPALEGIVREARRMGRLVEELLFVARHDAGGSQLEVETVELEALLAEIAARAEALTRPRSIALVSAIDVQGRARVDPEQLGRAVLAIVDNAARVSQPGQAVELLARSSADRLELIVADRGPGIPPDVLPHIFDRFRRGDRSRGGQGGAGLGLAIALAVVDAHGGTIAAAERGGGGTLVTISLPTGISARPRPAADEGGRP
jgi:signal transduction histidine kinase